MSNQIRISPQRMRTLIFEIILILFTLLYLFPFYMVMTLSVKSPSQALMDPLGIPKSFNIDNFVQAWRQTNFAQALSNSVFITVTSVIMILIVTGMGSFAISKLSKRFSSIVYYIFVSGLMIPFYLALTPSVKLMNDVGLMNSTFGLSLFYVGRHVSFAVFLLVGFLRTIPGEISESAIIDGCRPFRLYWNICFPMLKPAITTLAILNSLSIWNDFLFPLLVLSSTRNRTLTLAQYIFRSEASTKWHLVFSAYLMAMTPLLILYFVLQRNIVEGIATGALKG